MTIQHLQQELMQPHRSHTGNTHTTASALRRLHPMFAAICIPRANCGAVFPGRWRLSQLCVTARPLFGSMSNTLMLAASSTSGATLLPSATLPTHQPRVLTPL